MKFRAVPAVKNDKRMGQIGGKAASSRQSSGILKNIVKLNLLKYINSKENPFRTL